MRRTDGELILLWTLPAVAAVWLSAFLLFPGFVQPMSPTLSADEVAAFYRDPENLPRIRYSMILFNWFAVGLIPILALIVLQIRQDGASHADLLVRLLACAAGGPTIFLMANLFWLLAAFRPDRDPQLTLLFNDLAWVTFSTPGGVPDRAERDPRPGDLPRPPGAPGVRALGRALQSRRRRRCWSRLRSSGCDGRPPRLGRPAVVLGARTSPSASGSSSWPSCSVRRS